MTLKDASAFQLLVIYLCNTRVKLEIHLSLPDNNVQNGASCMTHYLQPRVALLMNIHEASDEKERFVQPVSWRNLRWFSSVFGLLEPTPHRQCHLQLTSLLGSLAGSSDGEKGGIHSSEKRPACPCMVTAWRSAEGQEAMEMEVASQYPLYIPAGESRNHVETPAGSVSGKQAWK